MSESEIDKQVQQVLLRIEDACQRIGRDPSGITLMAVTKTKSRIEIDAAYSAGIRIFGENRVFEAEEKYGGFHPDAELHLIGHLQSNKAKSAAMLFSWVESIDKIKTAEALEKRLADLDKTVQILLEINTSGEESKFGYTSEDVMFRDIDTLLEMNHLQIRGLMTVGPFTSNEREIRDSFSSLYKLFGKCKSRYPDLNLDTLSMGMSQDFEYAIEEGATLVRIGSLIFGARQ